MFFLHRLNKECLDYWIPKCDWYDEEWFPDINLFSSFEHLEEMMVKNEFTIQTGLVERKQRIMKLWDQKLKEI